MLLNKVQKEDFEHKENNNNQAEREVLINQSKRSALELFIGAEHLLHAMIFLTRFLCFYEQLGKDIK